MEIDFHLQHTRLQLDLMSNYIRAAREIPVNMDLKVSDFDLDSLSLILNEAQDRIDEIKDEVAREVETNELEHLLDQTDIDV